MHTSQAFYMHAANCMHVLPATNHIRCLDGSSRLAQTTHVIINFPKLRNRKHVVD